MKRKAEAYARMKTQHGGDANKKMQPLRTDLRTCTRAYIGLTNHPPMHTPQLILAEASSGCTGCQQEMVARKG